MSLRKLGICPNAYYNYLKNRKADYHRQKYEIPKAISEIYHSPNGVDGHQAVHAYILSKDYIISRLTVHKYMNMELHITYKVYKNKLNQDFTSVEINRKWCTNFTYLFLTDGSKRYNCTIIDLHDCSVIASITDKHITADLAKRTLQKASDSQAKIDVSKLMLHADQGSQYTLKDFTDFYEHLGITQSISKAGYPYDNAPMERYFDTLKNDFIYQHYYHTEYVHYNHVLPHYYNKYKTLY